MAKGFSILDTINTASKGTEGPEKETKARFLTKIIPISKMYRNEKNFYSIENIEALAGSIRRHGLMQNLELIYAPCEKGEYRIIAGERRWEALNYLVNILGLKEYEYATCKITAPKDPETEQIEVIEANSYRPKTFTDKIAEVQILKTSLESIRDRGGTIEEYDISTGRLRPVIAKILGKSESQIHQLEKIGKNLMPEFVKELEKETIGPSAAYELARLTVQEQQEAYKKFLEEGEIRYTTAAAMHRKSETGEEEGRKNLEEAKCSTEEVFMATGREEAEGGIKAAGMEEAKEGNEAAGQESKSMVSESNTEEYIAPQPDKIISLCYSCMSYTYCNEKSNTIVHCNTYENKAESEKTEEQRYSEEQDSMDKETQRILKEKEAKDKIDKLPSQSQEEKLHQIRLAYRNYDEVCNGKQNAAILKNEGYQEGNSIEFIEYKGGKDTGRVIHAVVTYLVTEHSGLVEGYCMMEYQVTEYCL